MLSIDIIGVLGALFGLLTYTLVRTQLHTRKLSVLGGAAQRAEA
jgi:hypothetical protein